MNRSFEEMGIDFMPHEKSPLIEQPTDSSFDFPSLHVTAETSPVLPRWFLATAAVNAWAATPAPQANIKPDLSGDQSKNSRDCSTSRTVTEALLCSRLGSTPRVQNESAIHPVENSAQMMNARCSHFRQRGLDRFAFASAATIELPEMHNESQSMRRAIGRRTSRLLNFAAL